MSEFAYVNSLREVDGSPVLLFSLAIAKEDRPDLTFVWTIRVPFSASEMGLPGPGDLKRLHVVEDKLTSQLEAQGALWVGHKTTQGACTIIFRSLRRPPAEVTVKTGLLSKETFPIEWREDPNWSWHEQELKPTALELHVSRNRPLLDHLERNGDNPTIARPVDMAFTFTLAPNRDAFVSEAASLGYKLNDEGVWQDDEGTFWCGIACPTTLEEEVIGAKCVEFDEMARRHQGDFDGWATPVMR